jgi:hypothetical protein
MAEKDAPSRLFFDHDITQAGLERNDEHSGNQHIQPLSHSTVAETAHLGDFRKDLLSFESPAELEFPWNRRRLLDPIRSQAVE